MNNVIVNVRIRLKQTSSIFKDRYTLGGFKKSLINSSTVMFLHFRQSYIEYVKAFSRIYPQLVETETIFFSFLT